MASARAAALHALVALDRGRQTRLRDALDVAGLQGREQALANELAHGALRRCRFLDHVLAGLATRGLPRDPYLLAALRLGAYQLLFVAGMPAHAAVHETVALVKSNRGFANALLRQITKRLVERPADASQPTTEWALAATRTLLLPAPLPNDPVARAAVEFSLPDFLAARWQAQFGSEVAVQLCAASAATPRVFLRTLREASQVAATLAAQGVQCALTAHPRQLRWEGGNSPFASEAFRAGLFLAQDPTAQSAAEAVPCMPGDRVLDLCAAPGTKTMVLAAAVRPGGVVFAHDADRQRLALVTDNATRLGLREQVRVLPTLDTLPADLDAALVDAPCSNSGVLARRVEVRTRLVPEVFAELAVVQRQLLTTALNAVRAGGHVVYSTCSIDREENEDLVAAVLAAAPNVTLVREHLTLPIGGQRDGGYFAVLRRGLPAPAPRG